MPISQTKIDQVVVTGHEVFWKSVADAFPEAKTGDLSPDMVFQLERAMSEAVAAWIDNNVSVSKTNTVEILQHYVDYWHRDAPEDFEIDESGIEHITKLIIEGYNQGELCTAIPNDEDGNTLSGWWQINNC